MKQKIIIIIVIILAVLISAALIFKPKKIDASQIELKTAKVETGTISNVVEATGTLEAITTVEVGTQVSGIVEELYVDYNSYVKEGQLLAKIDTTNLAAQLEQSQASLDNAKAELDYQQVTYNRMESLNKKQLISQTDYDELIYNLNKAKASYKSALAQHKKNQINLDYAMIHSPIDGIVLSKAVEEGQTVAASFNTPTIFTIANDLTQMQVEADIDEADIGTVKEGQRVEFTVDAYPEEIFEGEVTQVRLEPTVTNNVVTYTIIIAAPNPEYKLMPGLTANIEVYVLEKKDILVVPSKALRFTPEPMLMASYMGMDKKPEMANGEEPPKMPDGSNQPEGKEGKYMFPAQPEEGVSNEEGPTMIWVKNGDSMHPVPVQTGLDDDINVEILDGLHEGDEVILSLEQKDSKQDGEKKSGGNPFMPKPPSGGPGPR